MEIRNITLPAFSAAVYEAIREGLYAEPGFSDVTVEDIATKLNAKPVAVNAALGHLIGLGLVNTEDWDGDKPNTFIHTAEHEAGGAYRVEITIEGEYKPAPTTKKPGRKVRGAFVTTLTIKDLAAELGIDPKKIRQAIRNLGHRCQGIRYEIPVDSELYTAIIALKG